LTRASNIFLKHTPEIFLHFASFEERHGNLDAARAFLNKVQDMTRQTNSVLVEAVVQLADLERRAATNHSHGNPNFQAVSRAYDDAISFIQSQENSDEKKEKTLPHLSTALAYLTLEYCRFLTHTEGNVAKAREKYESAVVLLAGQSSASGGLESSLYFILWLSYINLEASQRGPATVATVISLYDRALAAGFEEESKNLLWDNYVGFVQHRGSIQSLESVRSAQSSASGEVSHASRKRKQASSDTVAMTQRTEGRTPAPAAPQAGGQWSQWPQAGGFQYGATGAVAASYPYGNWQQTAYPQFQQYQTY